MLSTTSERLFQSVQNMPEPLLAEVLDFADFLRARHLSKAGQPVDISLASLCGGLENTQTFSESPLAIQQKLRNEWR